jgi:hypothetical protein
VLVLLLLFTSGTYITTTYLKSSYNGCEALIELNKKYMNDFIVISDLIRKQRMNELDGSSMETSSASGSASNDSSVVSYAPNPEYMNNQVMDSILMITESNVAR